MYSMIGGGLPTFLTKPNILQTTEPTFRKEGTKPYIASWPTSLVESEHVHIQAGDIKHRNVRFFLNFFPNILLRNP